METTPVGVGTAEVLVEVTNEDGAELDDTLIEDGWMGVLVEPQIPKAALQPASQWRLVLPHHPYSLQQLPKPDPTQVNPLEPPQVPSVETFTPPMREAVAVVVNKVEVAGGVETAELVFTVTAITLADEVDEIGDFVDVEKSLVDAEEDFADVD